VDYIAFNLLDYPMIIKHPMDLSTVKNKLNNGSYTLIEECIEEIQLIWDNCKKYNSDSSWIYKLAEKLERQFRKLVKNYLPALVMPPIPSNKKESLRNSKVNIPGSS